MTEETPKTRRVNKALWILIICCIITGTCLYACKEIIMSLPKNNFQRVLKDDFWQHPPPKGKPGYVYPPRTGPWSGSQELGASVEFKPDLNMRQGVIKLNEWGMPQVWTVALGIRQLTNRAIPAPLIAALEIGVGGTIQYVEMDWEQGVTFSAPMNAISIIATYAPEAGSLGFNPSGIYLTATLAPGDRPSNKSGPTRTIRIGTASVAGALATESAYFELPAFTRRVELMGPLLTGGGTQILDPFVAGGFFRFWNANPADAGFIVSQTPMSAYGSNGFAVPNWARGFTYYQDGTGGPAPLHAYAMNVINHLAF